MRIYLLIISVIVILNFNGILNALTGATALISPLILLLLAFIYNKLIRLNLIARSIAISKEWIIFLFLYLLIGTLSLVFLGYQNDKAIGEMRDVTISIIYIAGVAGAIYYINIYKKIDLYNLITAHTIVLTISALAILIVGALEIGYIFNPESYGYRQSGFFGNPNDAGNLCVQTLIFLFFLLTNKKTTGLKRYIYILLALLVMYASILTFSKSAILAMLIITLIYITINFNQNKKTVFIFVLVSTIVLSYQFNSLGSNLTRGQEKRIEGLYDLINGRIDDETTTGRSTIIAHGWNYIEKHIITGIGLGNFKSLPEINKASHNTFLVVWGESGIIPLFFYIYLIGILIFYSIKLYLVKKYDYSYLLFSSALYIIMYSFATNNLLDNRIFNTSLCYILASKYLITIK
ncbi:MAG: O-antigen ligase family protein [Lunatimonas sp.]|uniref:O-antigen ligase family protein n=1 Tax=Lunatimonas sp. TaxID=2060141 RepID=UPI00263AFAEA|nr:O-antigen ligase family protein [Lunatimonas sp.]MCC5936790.1 O-antigen ligase family protein [Lunatimonas sp.]